MGRPRSPIDIRFRHRLDSSRPPASQRFRRRNPIYIYIILPSYGRITAYVKLQSNFELPANIELPINVEIRTTVDSPPYVLTLPTSPPSRPVGDDSRDGPPSIRGPGDMAVRSDLDPVGDPVDVGRVNRYQSTVAPFDEADVVRPVPQTQPPAATGEQRSDLRIRTIPPIAADVDGERRIGHAG